MLDKTVTNWQAAADELNIEGRAFINGQMTDALSGETRPSINPATGVKLADVANCGADDADLAVGHARAAFDSGIWSTMAPADRKMVLVRWAELIEEHAEEIAFLECLDVGKPISDTTSVDVPSADHGGIHQRPVPGNGDRTGQELDAWQSLGPGDPHGSHDR